MGATTVGQIEDDVRIAQTFEKLGAQQMDELRQRAAKIGGPGVEDWKRKPENAGGAVYRDGMAT